MQTLRAGPLVLEPMTVGHAREMFVLLSEPDLYRHLDYGPPASVQYLEALYVTLEGRRSPDGAQHWLNWAIRGPAQGLVGYVQATVGRSGSAWIAYVLGSRHWGRGYATLATQCMMEHLVEAYAVRRFLATVERDNGKSITVLERLGFERAGLQESRDHELSGTELLFTAEVIGKLRVTG
jgi:ribosomal-protein-alanine N-acetyltransferase